MYWVFCVYFGIENSNIMFKLIINVWLNKIELFAEQSIEKKREKLIKIPSIGIFCLIFVHFEISIYKSAGVIGNRIAWNCAMVFNQTKNGKNRENKPLTV